MNVRFNFVRPKPLNTKGMDDVWIAYANLMGRLIAKDFTNLTRYWPRPVFFTHRVKSGRKRITIQIVPAQPNSKGTEIWFYLDRGTRPHIIRARKGFLAFLNEYQAGSRPNSLLVGPTKAGGRMIFARQVHHPGTKPRNWSKLMMKKWKKEMSNKSGQLTFDLVKASGHAIRH